MPMARLMVTAAPIRIGSALGVVVAVILERLLILPSNVQRLAFGSSPTPTGGESGRHNLWRCVVPRRVPEICSGPAINPSHLQADRLTGQSWPAAGRDNRAAAFRMRHRAIQGSIRACNLRR